MSSPASWARYRASMAARNPASVLPEPVGAHTSVCRPATIAGQPPLWASVGPPGNRRSNHTRTAGWNRSRIPDASETDGRELTDTSQTLAPRHASLRHRTNRERRPMTRVPVPEAKLVETEGGMKPQDDDGRLVH